MDTHTDSRRRPRRHNPVPLADRVAVSVDDAAHLLGVSRRTIYDLLGAGRLASAKIGARRVIPRTELERLLAEESS